MKTRFVAFACALAFAGLPACVSAAPEPAAVKPDPARLQDARRLMDAMKLREFLMLSMQQAEEQIPSQIETLARNAMQNDPGLSVEQKEQAMAHIGDLAKSFTEDARGLFADPALVDAMLAELVPLYAQTYTREEMRQLTAFYRSPLGQKELAAMPRLMAGTMEVSNRFTLPRMEKLIQKMMDTLGKKYPNEQH